jgi:hypothetical protein
VLAAGVVAAVFPQQLGIERSAWVPQNMLGRLALQLTEDADELGDSYVAAGAPEAGECVTQLLNVTDWVAPTDPSLFLTSRRVLGWACAGQGDDAGAARDFLEAARYWPANGLMHDVYETLDWRAGVRFTWRALGQDAAEDVAAEAARSIEANIAALDLAIERGEVERIDAPADAEWAPDMHDWLNSSGASAVYMEMTRLALFEGQAEDANRYLELAVTLRPDGWPEPDREALIDDIARRS